MFFVSCISCFFAWMMMKMYTHFFYFFDLQLKTQIICIFGMNSVLTFMVNCC